MTHLPVRLLLALALLLASVPSAPAASAGLARQGPTPSTPPGSPGSAPPAISVSGTAVLPATSAVPNPADEPPLPAPANLDFEQGELGQTPLGWSITPEAQRAGFGVDLTDQRPFQGQLCAVVRTIAFTVNPGVGVLRQRFDAKPWRGRRVRFRAALRVANGNQAQLLIEVDRPGQPPAVTTLADHPAIADDWHLYQIAADVAPDATVVTIGLLTSGDGQAFVDAAAFDALGPAGAGAAARPLDARAVLNLVAFTRLLGDVRYFHPSDQAAAADWGAFAQAAIARLDPAPIGGGGAAPGGAEAVTPGGAASLAPEGAGPSAPAAASAAPRGAGSSGPAGAASVAPAGSGGTAPPRNGAELAAALGRLFAPLAPALRVYASSGPPPALDLGVPAGGAAAALDEVRWSHIGLGATRHAALFSSMILRHRAGATPQAAAQAAAPAAAQGVPPAAPAGTPADTPPPAAFTTDLGGGAAMVMPTALYADAGGTLPRAAALPEAAAPLSLDDRDGRLAVVALTWNVLEHFDPALPAPERDRRWAAALATALAEAARGGAAELPGVLRRMLAASGDGQATLVAAGDATLRDLPLRWDWVENRLVITAISDAGADLGLHAGDTVTRIGGRDAAAAVQAAGAEVAAATPQWRRWQALSRLALGPAAEPLHLTLAPAQATAPPAATRPGTAGAPAGSPPTGTGAAGAGSAARGSGAGAAREVEVPHSVATNNRLSARASGGEAVREASPGVLVVDLSRLPERALEEAMPRLAQARAIVFDLRGYVRSTDALLAHLIAAPAAVRREEVPHWTLPDRRTASWGATAVPVNPASPHLGARLAFLASARDSGVAEAFLATAAALHLGAIVGAPTAGATGTVDSASLPGGFTLVWTAVRPAADALPAGTAVTPAILAEPTRAGLAAGRDEVLERALAQLAAAPAAGR